MMQMLLGHLKSITGNLNRSVVALPPRKAFTAQDGKTLIRTLHCEEMKWPFQKEVLTHPVLEEISLSAGERGKHQTSANEIQPM